MSEPQPKEKPTSVRVTKDTRAKLQALKRELGFRNQQLSAHKVPDDPST